MGDCAVYNYWATGYWDAGEESQEAADGEEGGEESGGGSPGDLGCQLKELEEVIVRLCY